MDLPTHVATADEAIPPIPADQLDGPDMRAVMPVEEMIADLRHHEGDVVSYVADWRKHMTCVGANLFAMFEENGDLHLMVGSCVDAQVRHRSRWIHFLCEDLDREEGRRDCLLEVLVEEGRYSDNRPANPRATTTAIRDYLRTEGRILINPAGVLTEGAGVPRLWLTGTKAEVAECSRATRAYHNARRRWRSEAQIKRAVQMLGKRTDNGWLVLERKDRAAC